jgi:hypothetical protein
MTKKQSYSMNKDLKDALIGTGAILLISSIINAKK